MKELKRKCVICGKKLKIVIKDDKGHYSGGHYFGRMKLYSKHRSTGKYTKLGDMKVGIVEGIGKPKEFEYWECDECYEE